MLRTYSRTGDISDDYRLTRYSGYRFQGWRPLIAIYNIPHVVLKVYHLHSAQLKISESALRTLWSFARHLFRVYLFSLSSFARDLLHPVFCRECDPIACCMEGV